MMHHLNNDVELLQCQGWSRAHSESENSGYFLSSPLATSVNLAQNRAKALILNFCIYKLRAKPKLPSTCPDCSLGINAILCVKDRPGLALCWPGLHMSRGLRKSIYDPLNRYKLLLYSSQVRFQRCWVLGQSIH